MFFKKEKKTSVIFYNFLKFSRCVDCGTINIIDCHDCGSRDMVKLVLVALGSMMIARTNWLAHEQARSGLLTPPELAPRFLKMMLEFEGGNYIVLNMFEKKKN